MNTPGKRVVTFFGDESYHELYFYIHIRRRTLAYGINLIIPSLVISMMTVLGFTLPPDACEKVTLETTILLSVIFFLQMVSNMSPPQSKSVPILAAFFSCCLMVVSCSCVFTVLVLSLHHRKSETHEMSPFMRRILVVWLPNVLFMRRPDHPRAPKPKFICYSFQLKKQNCRYIHLLGSTPSYLRYFKQCCHTLSLINKDLEKITEKVADTYKQEMIVSEWRFAAMAVDRMCLYLFSLFITISTCGIIMPHIITDEWHCMCRLNSQAHHQAPFI
uniref:Neur_chan_memb domain-containing protein n=1 Tax=Heterorhabditis bacteriophora TaxID=37862 RepID=A0A1I7WBR2_HETBA